MLKPIVTCFILLTFGTGAHAADDVKQCQARQLEIANKVNAYTGDPMLKKLIEGDADECMEALDHATKILNGDV